MVDLLETLKFLEQHPVYLYDSPVMGIRMSAVPLNKISAHLRPEEKISQLMQMKKTDVLQQKAIDLATFISNESGVPIGYFGVTGSLLLDIHRDFSDIDLIVYGMKNSEAVKKSLIRIYQKGSFPVLQFNEEKIREWCLNKTEMYPLTYEEAARIFERKWGRGLYHEILFSIHPVKLEEEVSERYGDRIFKPEGIVKIEATVSIASEAEFLPSIYKVEDVKIYDGPVVNDIYEVASYEGLYGGIAEKGEKIMAYGKLEKVIDRKNDENYHRVLIGSKEAKGKDYVKPI